MKKGKTYEEAFSELEKLVESIEDPKRDLSSIGDDIKKAMQLIKFCKDSIRGKAAELESLLKDGDEN